MLLCFSSPLCFHFFFFCFGSRHVPVSFASFTLLLMFFFSLIQLLAVFSSFVSQKLLSQTRRRTGTWNHLGSSSSRAGESTYVTYSFGNHFGGGHVYHAPGASYPGRSLAKGVPGRATIRHKPPTMQEPKTSPQTKQNKTKQNPLREQLASK
jgi:hypothetical protein